MIELVEARQWQPVVDQMPPVGKLVHLAMRQDIVDQENIRGQLLRIRRRAYEDELSIQAELIGCPGRSGQLSNGPILSALNQMSVEDAASIVNTYNYDLASAVTKIRSDTPTANRNTYANRLGKWDRDRAKWKMAQVAEWSDGTARAMAQDVFYTHNGSMGSATLAPQAAQCPVCQGWVNRGEVPITVAINNPPPYHPFCPHGWDMNPDKVTKEQCQILWMGK